MRAIAEKSAFAWISGGASAAIFALPAASADPNAPLPDFSGLWARNAFNFEPLPEGPAPLVNLKRLPDGTGDAGQLVGWQELVCAENPVEASGKLTPIPIADKPDF